MAKSRPSSAAPEAVPVPLSFESPESSNIAGGSYDPEHAILIVTFKGHRGSPDRGYSHTGFPAGLWREFVAAASKGAFYALHIRNHYTAVKL